MLPDDAFTLDNVIPIGVDDAVVSRLAGNNVGSGFTLVEVNWKVLTYALARAGHAVNKSSKNAKKPGEKHYLLSGFWFLNIVFFSRVCTKHLCVACCWRMMQLQLTSPRNERGDFYQSNLLLSLT